MIKIDPFVSDASCGKKREVCMFMYLYIIYIYKLKIINISFFKSSIGNRPQKIKGLYKLNTYITSFLGYISQNSYISELYKLESNITPILISLTKNSIKVPVEVEVK